MGREPVVAPMPGQESDPAPGNLGHRDAVRGGPVGSFDDMLLRPVEERIQARAADDADIRQYCHAQTLTVRRDASYGASHDDRAPRAPPRRVRGARSYALAQAGLRAVEMQPDPGMASEPEVTKGRAMESLVGHLLVATPGLRDPNFERTVVLLVAHEDGGALGVVLNRATEVPVGEVLGGWGGVASDPGVVFEGGPVQPEAAICLARVKSAGREMRGFSRVEGTIGKIGRASCRERV